MANNKGQEIKEMLVETLMLPISADEIGDDDPLFGAEGLGLDSVDALQIVVSLDKQYGLKIEDRDIAKATLQSVSAIVAALDSAPQK
jgi:acyl carrier protein